MKLVKVTKPRRVGSPAQAARRMSCIRQRLGGPIAATLLVIFAAGNDRRSYAGDATTSGRWNIMVVPSRQTAFSAEAKVLFNKHCASCHSRDGRAQTPVARQRHVQDLSECKLEDDNIVQQILGGTHNKTNAFKMPAFKEKLTRGEIETLVPLVKAFRPLPVPSKPTSSNDQSEYPRLVGIINLDSSAYAVFEKVRSSGHYFLLRENECHDQVTLIKITPKVGLVRITVGERNPEVNLTLNRQISPPKPTGKSGWFKNLVNAFSANPNADGVVLRGANLDLVLFLYSQFTGLTLLRSPSLPDALFDLDIRNSGPNAAARGLKEALSARGITTIGDGGKFIFVVPESEAWRFKPRSHESSARTPAKDWPNLFPGGAIINFPNTDLSRVLKLYADLTGLILEETQQFPPSYGNVNFTTQTALSKEECAFALETLLAWHGLTIVPVGSSNFKVGPVSDAKP